MMQQPKEENTHEFSIFSSSPAIWRMLAAAIQTLSEDCTFDIDADGLRTRSMDPSHVAMLDVKFPESAFERFGCVKPSKFTVHMDDFSKIVKRSEQKESFEVSRNGGMALQIKIGTGHYRREFELHLMDDELKTSPLPKLNFTTRFSMNVLAFQQILADVSVFSNHLGVSVKDGSVTFSGKGDSGKGEVSLGRADGALLQEINVESGLPETRAVYNLEYLTKIAKAVSTFSDFVRFEFSNKMPLKLEFTNANTRSTGPIQFYLAPKMMD